MVFLIQSLNIEELKGAKLNEEAIGFAKKAVI
jgi:hypothetical protein